jgi:hypothetical protein
LGSRRTRIWWFAPFLVGAVAAVPAPGNANAEARNWACTGTERVLFDNRNAALVGNGGRRPTFNTGGKAYCVTYVQTYHWNNGKGAVAAGFVGLIGTSTALDGLGSIGFWKATGSVRQGGAPNAIWRVRLPRDPPVVIRGTYSCSDSAAATWSQNQASAGLGFCVVVGVPAVITR